MLWQLTVNGLVAASVFAMVGVGVAMIYRVAGFFNFAHGAILMLGAYATYIVVMLLHAPLVIGIVAGIAIATIFGCLSELVVFRPLRRYGGGPLVQLLASLGMYIALQNAISLVIGDDIRALRTSPATTSFPVIGAMVTSNQAAIVVVGLLAVLVLAAFLRSTGYGRSIRAVSCNSELSRIVGIDNDRVILWGFAIGSSLAGCAGVLSAMDVDMTPTMGIRPLMMGIVAAIIGGMRDPVGVAVGAVILGLALNLSVQFVGSDWQEFLAFAFLLAFLLIQPKGVLTARGR
jgi:branched-chain amino acid transport system permease protein